MELIEPSALTCVPDRGSRGKNYNVFKTRFGLAKHLKIKLLGLARAVQPYCMFCPRMNARGLLRPKKATGAKVVPALRVSLLHWRSSNAASHEVDLLTSIFQTSAAES